jgi:hypothetical protein
VDSTCWRFASSTHRFRAPMKRSSSPRQLAAGPALGTGALLDIKRTPEMIVTTLDPAAGQSVRFSMDIHPRARSGSCYTMLCATGDLSISISPGPSASKLPDNRWVQSLRFDEAESDAVDKSRLHGFDVTTFTSIVESKESKMAKKAKKAKKAAKKTTKKTAKKTTKKAKKAKKKSMGSWSVVRSKPPPAAWSYPFFQVCLLLGHEAFWR